MSEAAVPDEILLFLPYLLKITFMEKVKKLYPLKFQQITIDNSWGSENIGIADLGIEDSVVTDGWLEGNSMGDIMETYIERVVGESVYGYYGRQFPLLVKFVDIKGDTPVFVHPGDEVAEQRYDALGGKEFWYVINAEKDARIYIGFDHDTSAREVFEKCSEGSVREIMNVIQPVKGDFLTVSPGTVHAASGKMRIAVIKESSDLPFRLYGKDDDNAQLAVTHLAEAMDFIDYGKYGGPGMPGNGDSRGKTVSDNGGHNGGTADKGSGKAGAAELLEECPEFTVTGLRLAEPLHLTTEHFDSFILYIGIEGEASVQVPATDRDGRQCMESHSIKKGEVLLIPAEVQDYFIVPVDRDTFLLEAMAGKRDDADDYIDPDTEPFLEGEDYEGLEDEISAPETAASPRSKGHEKIYS